MWLVALLLTPTAQARCAGALLSVSPAAGGDLPANGQLVLEAYGMAREDIADLRFGANLVRGDERVRLAQVAYHPGSFRAHQVVLVPTQPLIEGHWTLELHGEPVDMSWNVTEAVSGAPEWLQPARVLSAERQRYGCGPAVDVAVAVPVRDATWVEATVWSVDEGERTTMRLAIEDGRVSIGHEMCSGPFELEPGVDYFAALIAVSADGQRVAAPTSLRFTAP